jgi:hypothetical protein
LSQTEVIGHRKSRSAPGVWEIEPRSFSMAAQIFSYDFWGPPQNPLFAGLLDAEIFVEVPIKCFHSKMRHFDISGPSVAHRYCSRDPARGFIIGSRAGFGVGPVVFHGVPDIAPARVQIASRLEISARWHIFLVNRQFFFIRRGRY